MSYTPGDIFSAMGRKWWCDSDFYYPLDPNLRYSTIAISTMHEEWEMRKTCLSSCVEQCRLNGLRIPKQRATVMPRGTPQELELALFRAREEENRMRLRLSRKNLVDCREAFFEDGDIRQARIYQHFIMSVDYKSDCYMSDDE